MKADKWHKTKLLCRDELAEQLGHEEQLLWTEGIIDITDISQVTEFMHKNEVLEDYCEILMYSGTSRVIATPYKKFINYFQ